MALSKTHQDYWSSRIEKRSYARADGSTEMINEWQVRICHKGRREWFQLGSNNKVAASKRAAEIYQSLKLNGWSETIKKYKGLKEEKVDSPTLKEFFEAVRTATNLEEKTFALYCRCLRTIVAQIRGITYTRKKSGKDSGGHAEWLAKLDGTKLSFLDADKIRKWQKDYVAKAGPDPLKVRRAQHTANKVVRNARALFSKKVLPHIKGVVPPEPHPFVDVLPLKSGSMRYESKISPEKLLQAAKAELEGLRPEEYKIFLLGLFVGLRRNEIDKLLWSSVNFEGGYIRVEENEYFSPKTDTSTGNVPVDPDIMAILKKFHENARGPFVIESLNKPKVGIAYDHYRAKKHFQHLTRWLRDNGVNEQSPLHTLRKEYGRLVTEGFGIYAASRALRHGSIGITAAHYADDKRKIMVRMSSLTAEAPTATEEGGPG